MDSSNKPRQTSGSNTTIKPDDQSNYSLVNGCSRIEDTDKSALPDPKGSEMKPQQSWNDPCASPTSSVINNDEDPVYKDTTFSNHQSETVAKSQCRSNIMNAIGPKFIKLNRLIPSAPIEGGELVVNVSENNFSANSSSSRHMYAATAANVTFTYGRGKKARKALNDITIKVPVGTIYAILGPSGCGKTTLVHSLVGSIKPKSGYVKVFGEIPGSARSLVPGPGVGYMPQEIGLFEEFTIKETLFFFGRLYRLPREQIRDRIAFLVSFLDLPDKDCFVSKLSGGQKRRVSLAAALVHKPPLLVLDEPTVGIDPVLRQSIWNHLRSLSSKDGITVIITTHYIDEAQYANTVAFMRHGSLLEEGNPQELIKRFQLNNLEEVFLALCNHKINTTSDDEKILIETGNEKRSWNTCAAKPLLETDGENHDQSQQNGDSSSMFTTSSTETTKTNNSQQPLFSTNHSKSTSAKIIDRQSSSQTANARDLSSMSEKKTAVVIAQQQSNNINFHQSQNHHGQSTINRQPTSLSAPHVAQRLLMKRNKILDHFARSSALLTKNFIRMWRNLPVMLFASLIPVLQCTLFFLCLGRNPYDIPVSVYNEELIFHAKQTDSSNLYSLRLMNEIDNQTIQLFNVNSIDDGFETVRSGQAKAFIKFPRNFTQATFEKAVDYMSMDNQTLQHSFVDLYLDMSSQFHAMKIKEKLFEAYHRFSKKLLQENGYTPEIADSPIRIPPPIMGNENPTVTEFMAPGFIMSLSFFASIATAALTLVLERKDGLLERSLVSGVYPNEYIISHVITQTVVVIFQIILVLLLAFFIFHIPNRGPVFWISVLIVMQGVCGMAYGILISAIAKEENFTLAACMGSMFPQFLLSGVVWPVDTMPQFLIYVSTFVSQAKAIDAVRYMLYRGWDPFNHWDVALGFIISASWTVVFLFIATILFNINKS